VKISGENYEEWKGRLTGRKHPNPLEEGKQNCFLDDGKIPELADLELCPTENSYERKRSNEICCAGSIN